MHAAECRVCGAPAHYVYFGALGCQSCKTFFKRNAETGRSLKCHFNNACEINMFTRHVCSSCRLAKCFQQGMTPDRFRPPRQMKPKSKALRQHPVEKLSTIGLLEADWSLLTANQWTLISNLQHSFDESQLMATGRELINTYSSSQTVTVEFQTHVHQFLACTYETTGKYLCFNDDLCKLPFDDRSFILRNAADNVSCMGSAYVTHYLNMFMLDPFYESLQTIYGTQTAAFYRWATRLVDSDLTQFKLALALFAVSESTNAFSAHASIEFVGSLAGVHMQNQYAEVAWKYLVYKHGWHGAVKRFASLMSWLVALTTLMFHAQTAQMHVNDVDTLIEKTELTLILDEADQIAATGQNSSSL